MATTISRRGWNDRVRQQAESGFSLLEVLISMVVLTVGLVSLLGVFGLAMASTQTSQQDMIAKQLANEAYESIVTARNTSQMNWDDIQNVGSPICPISGASSCGIFLAGTNLPIYNSGADGIFGTVDDADSGPQILREPGPDGSYGNADDVQLSLTNYQRTILISQVTAASGAVVPSLRGVNITVQYTTTQAKLPKTYVLSGFISQYR